MEKEEAEEEGEEEEGHGGDLDRQDRLLDGWTDRSLADLGGVTHKLTAGLLR